MKATELAQQAALRVSRMMTERWPETRNKRSEAEVLDELALIAWALDKFADEALHKEMAALRRSELEW